MRRRALGLSIGPRGPQIILRAPSPGGPVEILEIPDTPSNHVPSSSSTGVGPEEIEMPVEPLIPLGVRRRELETELARRISNHLMKEWTPGQKTALINIQLQLELKLEEGLLKEGFSAPFVYSSRHSWRNAALTPDTRPQFLSVQAIHKTLLLYRNDIRQSPNFRRIIKAFEWAGITGKP